MDANKEYYCMRKQKVLWSCDSMENLSSFLKDKSILILNKYHVNLQEEISTLLVEQKCREIKIQKRKLKEIPNVNCLKIYLLSSRKKGYFLRTDLTEVPLTIYIWKWMVELMVARAIP